MKKIYAIPGLGTTKELFRELNIDGAEIVVLDWVTTAGNDSMKDYASRFAEKIDITKPFYLMGVSLGGMICSELSEIIKPEKTFLISSAKCRRELPRLMRFFKHFPLHLLMSEKIIRFINSYSRRIIGFEKAFLPEFIAMMDSMPDNYYKHCIRYIINWAKESPGKNIIHLHGTGDKLLKYKFVKADHIIEGGTHAMVVYKAKEISKIIADNL